MPLLLPKKLQQGRTTVLVQLEDPKFDLDGEWMGAQRMCCPQFQVPTHSLTHSLTLSLTHSPNPSLAAQAMWAPLGA